MIHKNNFLHSLKKILGFQKEKEILAPQIASKHVNLSKNCRKMMLFLKVFALDSDARYLFTTWLLSTFEKIFLMV